MTGIRARPLIVAALVAGLLVVGVGPAQADETGESGKIAYSSDGGNEGQSAVWVADADGEFYFGNAGDRFVAGDWGIVDDVETPALFRPGNNTFYFRHTLSQGFADSRFPWQTDSPQWYLVAGAFDLR